MASHIEDLQSKFEMCAKQLVYFHIMIKELLKDKKLILASGSPRRRELMQKLDTDFAVEVSEVDETVPEGTEPEAVPEYLSGLKAEAVYRLHPDEETVVVGADTIVLCGGVIYGKPADEKAAFDMLKSLGGRTHQVITGVTIISGRGETADRISFSSVSEVEFYELSDSEIREYIATGEPMDKAGAYGIQDHGALIVRRINGDYYSVMGLPIAELAHRLKALPG